MRILSQIIILISLFGLQLYAQSPHGENFNLDCSLCHQSSSWKVDLKKMEFDHSTTNFELVGQHKIVDCKSCHQSLKFEEKINEDCVSCHTDIHKGTVGKDCSRCHTPDSWIVKDINGLHQMGRFPLVGKHLLADCVQCHSGYVDLTFEPLDTDCFSCHAADYNSTTNPNHAAAGFSTSCYDCHSINAFDWATVEVVHDFFPLVGGHNIADCFSCHTPGGDFTGLSPECISCHQNDYNSTTDPNHVANNFPTDCSQCHTIMGWSPASFNHDLTQFPLTGKHVTVECSQCHANGYSNTPMDCYACHQTDYQNTNDPNHIQAGFSTDCSECHTTAGWDGATFDHSQTQFPLTGRHIDVDCSACHQSGYSGTPMDCYACHQTDYENTNDPNHVTQGYPTDCTQCHTTAGWDGASFDHSTTGFALTGAHATAQCISCHANGYSGTPTDCYSCHSTDYNGTTDPNHQSSGFPTTCDDCHSTSAWSPASFDHNFYPISSQHNGVTCGECHSESNYDPQCLSCHQNDFNEGHHSGDPTTCWDCHSTSRWGDAAFDHNNTNFPLTGAHTSVLCLDCHTNGYAGTPTECFACHETNYNNTTNPNHQTLQLSTTCTDCHTTDPGWSPALYPQHSQIFELIGAHANITNCDDCHNGNYNSTPNTCIGCHTNDYNSTTDPPHQSLNFPQTCLDCHNMNGWTPATFDHSIYPTGNNHSNVQCNECHSQPNYDPQCLSCHQEDFNQGHSPGDPTDCWACHSTSNWDSNFNHNNTNFPLTGAHIGLACIDCHAGGYQGTPTECFACHETNYNNTTNPNHQTLQLSTTCTDCHTTDPGWSPALFPQHSQYFELIGAHANITNCDDCHNGNYTNPPNTCMGCHSAQYNGTTDPPHQSLNFPQDCLQCHNMNGWTPATFDHSFYPTGSHHNNLNCNQCHSQSNYDPQCLSCHQSEFNEGHNQGDPTTCWDCHSTSSWGNASFNHNNTNFPLTGAHVGLACLDCHSGGYQGTPTECFACHESFYNNTTNPNHQTLQLPTTCTDCHTTDPGWSPALFPQHSQYFELVGAHANITNCNDCHNGNYNNPPNTCMGCHSVQYNGTTDPPHQTLNFPQDCLQCHNMNGWTPATFDHSFYPTGSHHTNVNCNQCHSETNYQPQCLSCHYDDFLEGHNPTHSTDCWNCHSTSHWGDGPNPKLKMERRD